MPFSNQDINDQYQKYLGRAATQSEMADFNRFKDTGYVDLTSEDLGRIIQSHPEYQQQQLKNYGSQYENLLGQGDQRILNMAQNDLTGQFAGMGRNVTGSGYVNAFAQAAAGLAAQRQNTLANYYGQGFNNIMGQQVGRGNQAYGLGYGAQEKGVQRGWDIADYYRQQNDYNNALNGQESRNLRGSLMNAAVGLGTMGLGGVSSAGLSGFGGSGKSGTQNSMQLMSNYGGGFVGGTAGLLGSGGMNLNGPYGGYSGKYASAFNGY